MLKALQVSEFVSKLSFGLRETQRMLAQIAAGRASRLIGLIGHMTHMTHMTFRHFLMSSWPSNSREKLLPHFKAIEQHLHCPMHSLAQSGLQCPSYMACQNVHSPHSAGSEAIRLTRLLWSAVHTRDESEVGSGSRQRIHYDPFRIPSTVVAGLRD